MRVNRTGITLATLLVLAGMAHAQSAAPSAAASVVAEAGSKLGLGDRRALKKYQDETYPGLLKQIHANIGFDVEVEVKWDALAIPEGGEQYNNENYWTKIFFIPMADAFKQVAKDDMGKQALKKGIKKIVCTYDEASAPASNYMNGLTMEGGVLTINWRPYSNADDVKERTEVLVKILESKL